MSWNPEAELAGLKPLYKDQRRAEGTLNNDCALSTSAAQASEFGLFPGQREREREKLAGCSVTVSPSLRHRAKQHSTAALGTPAAGCTGPTPAPYQPCCSPPCLTLSTDTHRPATISTHNYHRITFIMYFRAVLMLIIISRKHNNELCFLFCFCFCHGMGIPR